MGIVCRRRWRCCRHKSRERAQNKEIDGVVQDAQGRFKEGKHDREARRDPTSRAHLVSFSRTNTGRWFKHLEAAGLCTQHRRSAFSTPMRRISMASRKGGERLVGPRKLHVYVRNAEFTSVSYHFYLQAIAAIGRKAQTSSNQLSTLVTWLPFVSAVGRLALSFIIIQCRRLKQPWTKAWLESYFSMSESGSIDKESWSGICDVVTRCCHWVVCRAQEAQAECSRLRLFGG